VKYRLPVLALLTASWGCVYYNGLWNAHRWAADAQQKEREGQHEAAVVSWSQAAVEAESVAVHHPHSGWLPDALVTAAEGLAGSRDCTSAAPYFTRIPAVTTDSALLERAALAQAACALDAGDVDGAAALARPVLSSKDQGRRDRAALLAGRAEVQRRRFEDAASILARSPDRAAGVEEVMAVLDAGRTERADSLCDPLVRRKPLEEDWDSIFAGFARNAGAEVASRVVGRVVPRARLTAGERARLFLADGYRLLQSRDPMAAGQRFQQAETAAPDSAEADKAKVAAIWAQVAQTRDVDSVAVFNVALVPFATDGSAVTDARQLRGILGQLIAPDTSVTGAFRAGEIARDSLYADPLAASLLLGFARRQPTSLFAAKAIVAALPMSPERAESLSQTLDVRYATSPYFLATRGSLSPGYGQAEDSLARLFGIRAAPVVATGAGPQLSATWTAPQTGRRGPLLNPPDVVPARPTVKTPGPAGRRGVADTLK